MALYPRRKKLFLADMVKLGIRVVGYITYIFIKPQVNFMSEEFA
jgi:hypothetical protein